MPFFCVIQVVEKDAVCCLRQAEFIVTDDSHFDILSSISFPKIEVKSLDEFASEW